MNDASHTESILPVNSIVSSDRNFRIPMPIYTRGLGAFSFERPTTDGDRENACALNAVKGDLDLNNVTPV
jgi:hypothetical protein